MANTKAWKVYNGIEVTVDEHGDFCATVGDISLRQACWDHLRRRIEAEKKADATASWVELDCVVLLADADENYRAEKLVLRGLNRSNSSFKFDKPAKDAVHILPYTVENSALLDQLVVAKSTVRDIEEAIKPRLLREPGYGGRIESTKYSEELENLKRRYAHHLKLSKEPVDQQ